MSNLPFNYKFDSNLINNAQMVIENYKDHKIVILKLTNIDSDGNQITANGITPAKAIYNLIKNSPKLNNPLFFISTWNSHEQADKDVIQLEFKYQDVMFNESIVILSNVIFIPNIKDITKKELDLILLQIGAFYDSYDNHYSIEFFSENFNTESNLVYGG